MGYNGKKIRQGHRGGQCKIDRCLQLLLRFCRKTQHEKTGHLDAAIIEIFQCAFGFFNVEVLIYQLLQPWCNGFYCNTDSVRTTVAHCIHRFTIQDIGAQAIRESKFHFSWPTALHFLHQLTHTRFMQVENIILNMKLIHPVTGIQMINFRYHTLYAVIGEFLAENVVAVIAQIGAATRCK